MKSKYVSFVVVNLLLCLYISYRYGILDYLGVLMIVTIHELGHYMFALIKGGDPEFIVSSKGDPGVEHDVDSVFVASGGVIFNLLSLPIFVGMRVMDMTPFFMVLLIIGGSLYDIVKITKMLRRNEEELRKSE